MPVAGVPPPGWGCRSPGPNRCVLPSRCPSRARPARLQVEPVEDALPVAHLHRGRPAVVEQHRRGLGDAARRVVERRCSTTECDRWRRRPVGGRCTGSAPSRDARSRQRRLPASMSRVVSLRTVRHRRSTSAFDRQAVEGSRSRRHVGDAASRTAGAAPVASTAVPARSSVHRRCRSRRTSRARRRWTPERCAADGGPGRAARRCAAAFARLAPQGSDDWNFLAAFTHLGDRYGPYHPGASALSDALETERRAGGAGVRGAWAGSAAAGRRRGPEGDTDRARGSDGPRGRGLPFPVGPGRRRSKRRLAAAGPAGRGRSLAGPRPRAR